MTCTRMIRWGVCTHDAGYLQGGGLGDHHRQERPAHVCYSRELTYMILAVYREGDLVTITDRNDLQVALKEVVEQADRLQAQHGGPKLPNMVPPVRIHATRAKSEVSCA